MAAPNNKKAWIKISEDGYIPARSVPKTSLPANTYTVSYDRQHGYYLNEIEVISDDLVQITDHISDQIIKLVRDFRNAANKFKKFGFIHKRGIMLNSKAGYGKTSAISLLARELIKEDCVVIYDQGDIDTVTEGLIQFRRAEPDRLVMVIIEDIDRYANDEEDLLALLDGEKQINNIIFLGTSNHPNTLSKRLLRPSRFDEIVNMLPPDREGRKRFLSAKNPELIDDRLDAWLDNTDGFTIAELKGLIILVECLGNDLINAIKKIVDNRTVGQGDED